MITFLLLATTLSSFPSDILNLTNWSLELPISSSPQSQASIIKQPSLKSFSNAYFYSDSSSVYFSPIASGATTPGSMYSRTELREMKNNENAAWDINSGFHSLTVSGSINSKFPAPVIISQLFSMIDKNYIAAVRINVPNFNRLNILKYDIQLVTKRIDGSFSQLPLFTNYIFNTPYVIRLIAQNGVLDVYFTINGITSYRSVKGLSDSACYWKAGAYLQGNQDTPGISADDFVVVVINGLELDNANITGLVISGALEKSFWIVALISALLIS